ncbi:PAS domain-containing protein [Trichocoleus sp. FACHB-591]|uniref:PAS domain-containing sensor histidine kinase n=1 Tax=Trichocoleus sp. FACHB-591 TaxID=2692872 RepID=UPI001683A3EB|nr:PAS domain-containing protein [Trichocoleus sp. FACHB-591]MBD2094954.1 PAS domain-containing protein [Trichocoleus sp. FACHB-591]
MHHPLAATSCQPHQSGFTRSLGPVQNGETMILDPDGYVCSWNAGVQNLEGYQSEEVIGQHFSCFFPAEDMERGQPSQVLATAITQGRVAEERWQVRRDGSRYWASVVLTALFDLNGQLQGISQVTQDLTARKLTAEKGVEDKRSEAEVALSMSQAELMTLFGAMQDVILVISAEGRYLKIAPSCAPLLYRPSTDLVGKTMHEVLPRAAADFFLHHIQQALTTQTAVKVEYSLPVEDQLIWFDATLVALTEQSVLWVARDISARKQAEQALVDQVRLAAFRSEVDASLTRSDDLQEMLHQCTNAVVGHLDAAFARIWLLNPEENILELQASSGLYTHLDGAHARVPVGQFKIGLIAAEREPHLTNTVLDDPRVGDKAWALREGMVAFAGYPLMVEDQLLGVIALFARQSLSTSTLDALAFVAQEVALGIKRKQTETALRQSETQLREKAQQLESTLWELQQTQTQIIQSEKMSSLGQLVAGVAHEINNPVNFIYGNLKHANEYTQDLLGLLQLYQQHYPHPIAAVEAEAAAIDLDFLVEDLPKLLSSMKIGAERIRQIVVSLRHFSHMDEAGMKAVNLHEGIDSTLMILQNRFKAGDGHLAIELVKNYGDIPLVECYAGQLNQVFMNILTNAIDALESQNQQRSLRDAVQNSSRISIYTERASADRVRIRIADNGPGLSPVVQQRLFDPFFTTKPVGKGTGLGMSISYQIVKEKHGGSLHCVSEIGHGAEFVIEIPISQEPK